jgi:hypothetical protein
MKNITVSIDDDTWRRARLWAANRDTSVSAIVRCILTSLPARGASPKPAPPTQPAPPAPAIQASADVTPVLIPDWGLTVLRTTLNQAPPRKSPNTPRENPIHRRSTGVL